MKVDFKLVSFPYQEEAVIRATQKTEDIQAAMDILEHGISSVIVYRENEQYLCKMENIYYAESVDKRTFIYTIYECYQTKKRLYELEEELSANFMRCSKSLIVNIKKIKAVKSDLNGLVSHLMGADRSAFYRM